MGGLPPAVEDVLDHALVAELTVVNGAGRFVTYPLIPLYDRDAGTVSFTSSVLFSRKLEHVKADPRVSVSVTDPDATPGVDRFRRVTLQGRARVIEDDTHRGWMGRVYELWKDKEPVIEKLVRMRFAFPLFFERSVIEVTPTRVMLWPPDAEDAAEDAQGATPPPDVPEVYELTPAGDGGDRPEVSARG